MTLAIRLGSTLVRTRLLASEKLGVIAIASRVLTILIEVAVLSSFCIP